MLHALNGPSEQETHPLLSLITNLVAVVSFYVLGILLEIKQYPKQTKIISSINEYLGVVHYIYSKYTDFILAFQKIKYNQKFNNPAY